MSNSKRRVLFFVSGSIAAFKACQVISRLVQDGNDVQVVATPSALKFVGSATFEGLTGKPTLSDIWEEGRAMDHIRLSRWADMGVICPATANLVAKSAHGLADDLVSALLLAWPKDKPLEIFPAMNTEMYDAGPTRENFAKLAARGWRVHETRSGNLACGEVGAGRLLEPEEILQRLQHPAKGRVLITAGATREPVDGIRFISNVSTGQTGARLADRLTAQGWEVTYLHGQGARLPNDGIQAIAYTSFADLDAKLRETLATYDFTAVIHAAAVGDYSVDSVNGRPIENEAKLSGREAPTIKLRTNFKILPRLKEYARNKNVRVIGFKLTLNADDTEAQARAQLGPAVDAVVANEWQAVGADRSRHPGAFLTEREKYEFDDLDQLSRRIGAWLEGAET
ncbi:MAG TPA: bifunctional phosphopantothenoylcysteine decarboxylase/phosphopantothenate--cysteine ligase CoaBC [Bdellovibrionales bacterium]|nr:bifunctional phosphopantothenoylcysteine decarboxylase/phosphopantothenate--cysteine ligase CoaBC [Bdellovibrionales bacterium]